MGSKRPRTRLGIRLALTVAGLALVVPAPAPAVGYSGGVVPEGIFRPCGKGGAQSMIEFDFAGRMPSDGRFYQIPDGKGSGSWGCAPAPIELLTLTGTAAAGSFEWTCSGSLTVKQRALYELRQVLDLIDDTLGLPALFDRLTGGPTYLLDVYCSTVGTGDLFRYRAVLEAVEDQNPDPYNARLLVRGAFVAVVP